MRRIALALVAVLCSCLPFSTPGPTSAPSPSPTVGPGTGGPSGTSAGDMTAALLAKAIPTADVFDLVRRLKGRDGAPAALFQPVRAAPPAELVGSAQEFWLYDFQAKRNVRITATLRVMTASAKWWVQADVQVDEQALARSAQTFQDRIYPTDRRIFGEEWTPGIDADPRIDVLVVRIPGSGVAGYFSSADELPRWVNEFSAEREMIYVNALAARLGTDTFHSVLAHEFCHMIQFNKRVGAAVWFNEGQAQLCERANGFPVGVARLFLQRPDTQLDAWDDIDQQDILPHYGGAYLFLEYLRARTGGGYGFMNTLLSQQVSTLADIDRALRAGGFPPVEQILADFVAANALIGTPGAEARFTYPAELGLRDAAKPTAQDVVTVGTSFRGSAHPQAARYIELPRAAYRLTFTGTGSIRVIPTDAHSGRTFWWSDRADGMDSTLTREVDLTATQSAALTFWTWYDIEDDFDYAYVAASTDGGARWATLAAPATTTSDPNGNNLGNGFTATSGSSAAPVWVQQRVDLSPFAGKRILLRFEHVTDGALNKPGFAVDDIEIPEIGYRDGAEDEHGWDANGFILSTNTVRGRYVVQLIRSGATPTVEQHVVDGGTLQIDVDASGDRAAPILAVTPLAPRATDPSAFELQLAPRP